LVDGLSPVTNVGAGSVVSRKNASVVGLEADKPEMVDMIRPEIFNRE
jgi:hypothetical protein